MNNLTIKKFNEIFPNEISCINFLVERGVFYETIDCEKCGDPMIRYLDSAVFRCHKRTCGKGNRISIRKYTFFYGSALKCIEIMQIAQFWISKMTVDSCIYLTGHSPNTICNFYNHCRVLVTSALQFEDQIIGGPEIVVQIDETKLGKRKYHRGHMVDGVWVVVGIEKIPNGKIFLVPVLNRSVETLNTIVYEHVRMGSIIHTDMWRGYNGLETLGFIHQSVNHSQNFIDPETLVCTNLVEGLNSGLKRRIPIRNRVRTGIEYHLGEYIWRRQNKGRIFEAFVDCLRDIHYEF